MKGLIFYNRFLIILVTLDVVWMYILWAVPKIFKIKLYQRIFWDITFFSFITYIYFNTMYMKFYQGIINN